MAQTIEERINDRLTEAVNKTKHQLFTDFCNATTPEQRVKVGDLMDLLPTLTFKLKNHIKG